MASGAADAARSPLVAVDFERDEVDDDDDNDDDDDGAAAAAAEDTGAGSVFCREFELERTRSRAAPL